ncbi:hydroxyethylthiazole kinase [Bifidobacterium thermophilum]|uniref:hydroxyethylthiazole kinase n=1 Tax=Bifidobacterium thermophilum TaxID=33905 RepID=UPI0039965E35
MSTDASPDTSSSSSIVDDAKRFDAHTEAAPLADDDHQRELIAQAVDKVRDTTPLAQSFTNFVTINLVANAQLAAGGTAAMSYLPDDIIDTAAIAKATYINVGTLLPFFKDALGNIARSLQAMHHSWVLDPVAAGIGRTRSAILWAFRSAPPTIVRGNASEIIALAGIWDLNVPSAGSDTGTKTGTTRPAGVEAVDDVDSATNAAIVMARYLRSYAPNHRAAVAVSGATDLVTDGDTVYRLPGGSPMMTKITGAGCSLGGVTATYLAVTDPLTAALTASALYNRASEEAERASNGPGSFQTAFLDALWSTTAQTVSQSPITAEAA